MNYTTQMDAARKGMITKEMKQAAAYDDLSPQELMTEVAAEHLRLPDMDDMKEGIIAARIAAHSGDIAKGLRGAADIDYKMNTARKNLDWEGMFELGLDPIKPRRYRESSKPEHEDSWTRCGKLCVVRTMNTVLSGKKFELKGDNCNAN